MQMVETKEMQMVKGIFSPLLIGIQGAKFRGSKKLIGVRSERRSQYHPTQLPMQCGAQQRVGRPNHKTTKVKSCC